jgi:hypothetical protein
MTVRHLGDLIIYLGAVAGALAAIGALLRWGVVKPLKRWLAAEVRGPLDETRTSAAAIEAEVSHNHGTSLKDAVTRTEVAVQTLSARFDDHLINHPKG